MHFQSWTHPAVAILGTDQDLTPAMAKQYVIEELSYTVVDAVHLRQQVYTGEKIKATVDSKLNGNLLDQKD